MLRVRVCAAHMNGLLGSEFPKQGSFFGRFSFEHGWALVKFARKKLEISSFPRKLTRKVGMKASFGN